MYPKYMCILLYVIVIWCNVFFRDPLSIGVVGTCILHMCAFCDMCILFGVTLIHRCLVNWTLGGRCVHRICAFSYM